MRNSDYTPICRSTFDFEGAGEHLTHPMAVVRDETMTTDEKRSVLASWASDERAVPNYPSLRRLDNGCLVEIDDVLAALKRLDQLTNRSNPCERNNRTDRRKLRPTIGRFGRRDRDNDDDDPPTPTPAAVRPRPPVLEGGVAEAV